MSPPQACQGERMETEGPPAGGVSDLRIDREAKAGRGRWRRVWAVGIVIAIAAVVGLILLKRAPTVTVAQVREARPGESVTELSAAGYVAAERRSVVSPKVAGRLDKVLAREGERVTQGQVIARMDDEDARIALLQSEAASSAARAQLAASRAEMKKAERIAARSRRLVRGGAETRENLKDAVAAADAARANERAASDRVREADRVEDAARLHLDDTIIRAPFTGTVVHKLADEGAVLAPAAIYETNVGGILELVDLNSLDVEAEVSEQQLRLVRQGQSALVFLDAFPDRVFRGEVGTVRPSVDRSKATAVVKVLFSEEPLGALPDMSAKVSFLSKSLSQEALQDEARLRVPASSVVERDGKSVVLAVEDGRIREHPVTVAQQVGNEAALADGPKPGTQVVASPTPKLKGGRQVRVKVEGT
jgi:RND family efflux transporter MFP subunit